VLTELRIRNLAIVEEVGLEFSDGFTVLTGETGTGKSILVDALDLLIGGRASTDLIRTAAEEAEVSAVFSLPPNGQVAAMLKAQDLLGLPETELILRRILARSGRHRIHVNGHPASLSVLQGLRGLLVDIHGQHDQQSLFKPAVQLELLDAFGGLTEDRHRYAGVFAVMRELEKRLQDGERLRAERQASEDFLRYQVDEIGGAHLRAGEDRELERERLLLSEGRRLAQLVQQIYGPLDEEEPSVLEGLRALAGPFKDIAAIDTELLADRERFEAAAAELADLAHRLRDYRDRLDFDPERLDKIEERLDLLHRLMKKYGDSVEEVVARGREAERQLHEVENLDADRDRLAAEVVQVSATARSQAEALSRKRAEAAGDLERRLEKELKALHMERARVRITVAQSNDKADSAMQSTGLDDVQFLFSANVGEPPQPLSRIASGGELSRVMLAIKSTLAALDQVPVLVFDEVDAGIGGAVAEVVGKRLKQLSQVGHQVFCITHLAPIAAQAQSHFAVSKMIKGGRTVTNVTPLNKATRVEEIARMLGGATITPKIRETAKEMLTVGQR
jgi:DNA repair protein RecN (Recombination protein N)